MKFDFGIRWIQSGSGLPSRAERERSLDHTWTIVLGHICLRLVQQVWLGSSSKDLSCTLLPANVSEPHTRNVNVSEPQW